MKQLKQLNRLKQLKNHIITHHIITSLRYWQIQLPTLILTLALSTPSLAITPESILDGRQKLDFPGFSSMDVLSIPSPNLFFRLRVFSFIDTRYQIGEEWGKIPVAESDLSHQPYFFERMARSTAKIRQGGTGFYIGRYLGRHVIATNHHVCPSKTDCASSGVAVFPMLGSLRATAIEFYGSWENIDLALFSVRLLDETKTKALESVASPFDMQSELHHGQPLTTIGFGIANNPTQKMVANQDTDCRVYSPDGEYRFMGDPDEFNPATYKAWSFANGCDVSHGDSGSAMMDRNSGKVVGIIWTGRIPKNERIQNRSYMDGLFNSPTEEIWTELSYSVPAPKIKEFLESQINQGGIEKEHVPVLQSILNGQMDLDLF